MREGMNNLSYNNEIEILSTLAFDKNYGALENCLFRIHCARFEE